MNLLESGPQKILFHYTNFEGFIGILKSGVLRVQRYPVGTHDLKSSVREKWKEKGEIATIRPSLASTRKMSVISPSASDKIRFIIKAHELLDRQRNVKIKPLAEFPVDAKKRMIENISGQKKTKSRSYKTAFSEEEAEKIVNKLISNTAKLKYRITKSDTDRGFDNIIIHDSDLSDYVKKITGYDIIINTPKTENSVKEKKIHLVDIRYPISSVIKWGLHREGEERIAVKRGIKLDPKVVKIELLPEISLTGFTIDRILAKRILLKKDLFVKNSSYKRLIEKAKEVIQQPASILSIKNPSKKKEKK